MTLGVRKALYIGIITLLPAFPATANTIGITLNANVNTSAPGGPLVSNTTSPGGSLTLGPGLSISNSGGSASVTGSVVQFGNIVPGIVSATGSNASVQSSGSAVFIGIWQDTFIAGSNTGLAFGTPVNYLFAMPYNFSTTCSGPNTGPQAIAQFQVGSQPVISASTSTCNTTVAGTQTFNFLTTVGATTQIEGFVSLSAVAGQGTSVLVDPSINFFINPLTGGASYTTGSGTNYASPVTPTPEPSSLLLFGTGLIGLGLLRSRFLRA